AGNGTFAPHVDYPTPDRPWSIAAGDLNGDGDPDLAVAHEGTSSTTVSVVLNNGNGTFAPYVVYGVGLNPNFVAMGDLDGDGDRDLAVTNAAGSLSVLLNAGNG